MALRSSLHQILKELLGTDNVYFQPPPTIKMLYPCIVYERDKATTKFAGNRPYKYDKKYKVTYIDGNPDSDIPDKLAMLPKCVHDRFFTADSLNHDVFNLFY